MSWQEKIEKYTQKQEETLNLKKLKELKEEKAVRIMEEEKLRITKERNLPLIELLNKLPVKEFLTEIRDDEWKLGEVVAVPGEPKIRLIAKWPRIIPDHDRPIYKYKGVGDPNDDWSYYVVGYEPMAGYVKIQGEVIEIGARWKDVTNPKEQVFYDWDNLPPEFYQYREDWSRWLPNDKGAKSFLQDIEGERNVVTIYLGNRQPSSLGKNQNWWEKEPSLPKKEEMVLYGHMIGWGTELYGNYYSGFEGPSIDDLNVVSKIEESLIKMCLIRKKEKFSPPFDRYKKEYE